MSGKCISHFKMLRSVSGTYYGEVALTSPTLKTMLRLKIQCRHYVSGASEVLMTLKTMLRLKIQSLGSQK